MGRGGLVPVLDWQLTCDDCGGAPVAVFEGCQKVTPLWRGQDRRAPIVDDQDLHAGDGFEDAFRAAQFQERAPRARAWAANLRGAR